MDITNLNWQDIRMLYDKISDPFETISLQSVSNSLKKASEEIELDLNERMGSNGMVEKYWDVPMELLYEEKGYFVGNIFVLAQVSIVQTIIIFQKLRSYSHNKNSFPKNKSAIFKFKSNLIRSGKVSQIMLIDTVANYFKHKDEWSSEWVQIDGENTYPTMKIVKSIGMEPEKLTANMELALFELDASDDISSITNIVQLWREDLANSLSKDPIIRTCIK